MRCFLNSVNSRLSRHKSLGSLILFLFLFVFLLDFVCSSAFLFGNHALDGCPAIEKVLTVDRSEMPTSGARKQQTRPVK